jgi:hypothetical protein
VTRRVTGPAIPVTAGPGRTCRPRTARSISRYLGTGMRAFATQRFFGRRAIAPSPRVGGLALPRLPHHSFVERSLRAEGFSYSFARPPYPAVVPVALPAWPCPRSASPSNLSCLGTPSRRRSHCPTFLPSHSHRPPNARPCPAVHCPQSRPPRRTQRLPAPWPSRRLPSHPSALALSSSRAPIARPQGCSSPAAAEPSPPIRPLAVLARRSLPRPAPCARPALRARRHPATRAPQAHSFTSYPVAPIRHQRLPASIPPKHLCPAPRPCPGPHHQARPTIHLTRRPSPTHNPPTSRCVVCVKEGAGRRTFTTRPLR